MLVEVIKPDFEFADGRGLLIQLVHEGFSQVNYVFSKKDSIRGNFHYHGLNKETFFVVSGKLDLYLEYNGRREFHTFETGAMFSIAKEISHKLIFQTDTQMIVLYDVGIELENGRKDIVEGIL